jgi:hypothetical protein
MTRDIMRSRSASSLLSVAVTAAVLLAGAAPAYAQGPPGSSAVTSVLSGYARLSNGIAYYGSLPAIRDDLQILPRRAGRVSVSLQRRNGRSWKTDQVTTFSTTGDGTVRIGLSRGGRRVTYRFIVRVVPDRTAGASPNVVSQSFMVE